MNTYDEKLKLAEELRRCTSLSTGFETQPITARVRAYSEKLIHQKIGPRIKPVVSMEDCSHLNVKGKR